MKIKQCHIASPTKHSGKFSYFMEVNKLSPYKNPKKPAVFYGLYTSRDLSTFKKHKSIAIVVWGGSDILRKKNFEIVRKKKNVFHVARSSFIARDLEKYDIPYKLVPLIASPLKNILPTKMGEIGRAHV